ncbi:DUF2798 domain-containing protein [Catenovulum sp. 2E275]|uniref:DUF2798 domain-containing protein n=1 Tax=Catenovulum sp. 2E275 TaxID=2980497 RepID=UPI0021CE6238|nr:DUF2798 domain-containing protein [Catenovulum sp. 2E275]MCU4674558.1 DUF2798 domain-containing protein [Catenovulum sp. 2E275]
MINKQHQVKVFAFVMALTMSCIMSFVITLFNLGWINGVLLIWLKAWAFAFCVAFPTILLVTPFVRKIVGFLIKD